jgi:hypothetical protein
MRLQHVMIEGDVLEILYALQRDGSCLMYKFIVLASARVVCNIMVCKCEVEPIGNCILERKFKSKLIKS